MTKETGSTHLYFQSQRRDILDYDSGNAETGNERSFDDGRETSIMRDQSIQQGNGLIRRPRTSRQTANKKKMNDKYVSPFILSAEKRAQERARQYQESKRMQRRPEWNESTAPTGSLFDPTIHKQEIFKIRPRNKIDDKDPRRREQTGLGNRDRVHHKEEDVVNFSPNGRSRMVLRTSGTMPMHMKRLQDRGSLRRSEMGTSPMQSYDGGSLRDSGGALRRSLEGTHTTTTTQQDPVAVTRSTSPINQQVVTSILREDGIVHDDDYTIHIKSYQPLGTDKDAPYDTLYDPAYDNPPRDEEYYSNLLRKRLRGILLNHNDDSGAEDVEVTDFEDLNTSDERGRRPNRNNYAERKYLRSTSHGRSRSASRGRCRDHGACSGGGRGATEELMHSMAQIMTAVGSIVSKPQRKMKNILKKNSRYLQRPGHYIAPYESHNSSFNGSNHHTSFESYSERPSSPVRTKSAPSSTTAASAAPIPFTPATMPRSRSAMLDMIMAKLQQIEQTEDQMRAYLASNSQSIQSPHNSSSDNNMRDAHINKAQDALIIDLKENDKYYEINRQLHGVRIVDVSQLGANGLELDDVGISDMKKPGFTQRDQRSMAGEAQSEADISISEVHYAHPSSEGAGEKVSTHEQGTQDSAYSLQQLHAQLQSVHHLASLGPSIASLEEQDKQRCAESERLTPSERQQRERAYLNSLPRVPRNIEADEAIINYMKELNRCRELKDVAFQSRGVSMSEVADRMTDEILHKLVSSVSNELDSCMDQFSEKFVDKI